MYGIYVKNASANVTANQILNIATANPAVLGGCQSGIGVRFGSKALAYAATGSILSNTVSGYQKGGIVVDGPGTNVSVKGNVVAGSTWAFGVIAQNGIQISRGALGTASENVVSSNSYGNNYCAAIADGILLYDLAPGLIVTNNQVTGNDEGIGLYSDSPNTATNSTITSNTVDSNLLLGIHIDANSTGNDVWLNTIYLNSAYDEVDETGSFTSANDWGTTNPANANILGNGGVYSQKAGPLCH
jgi:parallel beta-helix repeat protein